MCTESAQTILWLGESLGFWVQTGAFILSAVGAIAIIYNNSHQAKKRATVDLVLHELTNPEIVEAKQKVAEFHDNHTDLTQLSCAQHKHKPENVYIRTVLNNYEFIAAGIKEGAFDEEIYKRVKRSILIRDWEALAAYVAEIRRRTGREKIFIELQWLAERWKKSEIKPTVSWVRRFLTYIGL